MTQQVGSLMLAQTGLLSLIDLHDFPSESRSPQTVYEGVGTFLACQPPAHYPGKLPKRNKNLSILKSEEN